MRYGGKEGKAPPRSNRQSMHMLPCNQIWRLAFCDTMYYAALQIRYKALVMKDHGVPLSSTMKNDFPEEMPGTYA